MFLLLGVSGLAGSLKSSSKKENKGTCLLALYTIGIFVFFVVFLGATIFFFVGPEAIFGTDCTTGAKTDLVKNLYDTSNEAYQLLCSKDCPCQLDAGSDLAGLLKDTPNNNYINGTVTKFADCEGYNSSSENVDVLAAIE